jgi:hydroxyacylglutathione hydrolase
MHVTPILCLKDNYAYIINDNNSKTVGVVDPSESKPIISFLTKNNLKLNYILNTHHHFDHVGGNAELKKLYNAKVVGFDGDKHRIPEIDITLKNNEKWNFGDSLVKIFHIPGHTLGHICFFFEKEAIVFTGDTLFSLGCGRIFEGDYKQMFNSLNKIKNLPKSTNIYCGHEYTYKNAEFCSKHDANNINLKKKFEIIKKLRSKNLPTIPTTLEDELNTNIFLRCDQNDLKIKLNMENQEDIEVFKKIRDLKDSF